MEPIPNRARWVAIAWAALAAIASAQVPAEPQKLEMPKPAPAAIPPPSTTYTQPAAAGWSTTLLYSQLALAGAGTGATTAAQIRRYEDTSKVPAFTSIGVVGLAILLQRAYDPHMSTRTKKWVSIANFAGAGVLSGLMARDIGGAKTTLQQTAGK